MRVQAWSRTFNSNLDGGLRVIEIDNMPASGEIQRIAIKQGSGAAQNFTATLYSRDPTLDSGTYKSIYKILDITGTAGSGVVDRELGVPYMNQAPANTITTREKKLYLELTPAGGSGAAEWRINMVGYSGLSD